MKRIYTLALALTAVFLPLSGCGGSCNIKTINLLPAVLANQKAEEAGCDETIFHRGDRVTECSHSNVHILKDGALKTAPCDNLILPGITRAHRIAQCREMGVPVIEEPFTLDELFDADEVFFSSSSALTCRFSRRLSVRTVSFAHIGKNVSISHFFMVSSLLDFW